jgi:serine/threonine protein kinase/tetratricopeptide (TPR) repeat protein
MMVGKTILHYKIIEELGRGGMGVVYKAEDTKLKRNVAIKFLPKHISADSEERERFKIEAQSAAALSHPNIATIHAIEESDDELFIVMEFIDGQELKDIVRARRAMPLPITDVINYATQIAAGLQAAHEKDIIHRDIKSANIMITNKGQVKIMDFGLAKVRGGAQVTKVGTTIGTAAYMSPEQASSEEADNRSDIWSFGVVLYEMLTGKLPFGGDYEQAVIYAILNENPKPISEAQPEISPELQNIVNRALQKNPEERYQQIQDLLSDLKTVDAISTESRSGILPKANLSRVKVRKRNFLYYGIGIVILFAILGYFLFSPKNSGGPDESKGERKMIVVLPFENLGSPDQEYFADGLTEEITSKLSGLSGLGVIARSSAMQYKKTTKSIKQIGEELGVSYILQGTVRWEKENNSTTVRVNPQLVKVADGTQIWSEPAVAVLESAFKLQADIASQVASALNITLLQNEKQSLEAKLTDNPEAYDYYLRSLEYFYRSTEERNFRIAEEMLQKAVLLDPTFAEAYAKLAAVHSDMYWEYYDHTEERVRKSKEAAEKALHLDPNLPDAHGAMGWYYYHGLRDYKNAIREFNLALEAQPNNVDLLLGIGSVFRRQGKFDQAVVYFKQAAEIDPRSPAFCIETGFTYSRMRKYPEAERYFGRGIKIAPDLAVLYYYKADLYLQWKGNTAKARNLLNEVAQRKIAEEDQEFIYSWVTVNILHGEYQNIFDLLESINIKVFQNQDYFIPKETLLAQLSGYLNQPQKERENYDASRIFLEGEIQKHPDDARIHSSLGIAYAGLGRKKDAVREGKRAVNLLPITKEAVNGPTRVLDLARIYTMVGEQDVAIDLLEKLLSIPSQLSVPLLKIDPVWSPLRKNPRFRKLIGENT